MDSPELDRNRVQLRIGPSTDIDKDSTLRIGYEDELASSDQSHTASASFRMQW